MTTAKTFKPLEDLMPIAGPAVEAILALFRSKSTVVVACSFGKDSSCVMRSATTWPGDCATS